MKFYIVDAFTETLFGGNPAGVVILSEGAGFPDDETMRKTAAELRYSETAFIRRTGEREFNIRYFTPAAEVDLCGHATVGSFCALADAGIVTPGSTYINDTLAGRLQIEVGSGSVLMEMGKPESLGSMKNADDVEELYRIMGISAAGQGIVAGEKKPGEILLPELVSTGLPDIMMPVADRAALSAIKPDFPALSALSERYQVTGVHAFTVNAEDGAVHCRNFAPLYDIDEEAATGTSNGALTYYLYKYGLIAEDAENVFVQGEAMDRPSRITSRLSVNGGAVKIQVGGSAKVLARGEIFL